MTWRSIRDRRNTTEPIAWMRRYFIAASFRLIPEVLARISGTNEYILISIISQRVKP